MSLFRKEVLDYRKDRLHGQVVLSQPLSTKILVGALISIIAIAAIWLSLGSYARIETVPGVLVTDIPSAKVVPYQSGTVVDLQVKEGELVQKGDPLLIINLDRRTISGDDVADRSLTALEARREISKSQLDLLENRAVTETSRLLSIIKAAETQAGSLEEQIALQEQVVSSNQQIFDKATEVIERGFVSKIEYEQKRQTLLNSRQALASLIQRLTAARAEAQQAKAQLSKNHIETAQGKSAIEEGLQSLSAEKARLEGEQSLVLHAPINGRVTAMATGVGRPAYPGRPVLIIVPEESVLEAELYAPSRAVGFVEPGKEARLLYDAFPYQRFGSFSGRIATISRIAVDPKETEIPFPFEEPVYRVRVHLEHQKVSAYDDTVPLQPGMTLQANIILERQSFLQWLLKPLNAVLNRNS